MTQQKRFLQQAGRLLVIVLICMSGMGLVLQHSGGEGTPFRFQRDAAVAAGEHADEEEPFAHPSLSGAARTLDTPHFRVHFTLSGADAVSPIDADGNGYPDYVDEVARTLEEVRRIQVVDFGWTAPPSDGEWGGDSRYDVYLHHIEDALGYVDAGAPETIVGDNPNSPDVVETRAGFSVMGLDNDYAEVEGDPLATMRATAAHEYHHAIQAGYDAQEPMDWLWEATATWMQDEVYDDNNEGNDDLGMVFKAGPTCQLAYGSDDAYESGGDWYGLWILLRTVSERYGSETVRAIWEAARTQDGYAALETALAGVGTDLDSLLDEFSISLLLRDFEEGAAYPTVRLEGRATAGIFQPERGVGQAGQSYVGIDGQGVVTVRLSAAADEHNLTGTLVGVRDGQASLFPLGQGAATLDADAYDHLYLIVRNRQRTEPGSTCRIVDYTVQITAGGTAETPSSQRAAPHFTPPSVEPPLDSAFGGPDDWGGNWDDAWEEGWQPEDWDPSDPESPLSQRLAELILAGYTIDGIFDLDPADFDEEEALWFIPGGSGSLALLTTPSGALIDISLSPSPYAGLRDWLAAVDYEPLPEEIRSVAGVPALVEVWDDGYTSITLIFDGDFYVISGEAPLDVLLRFAAELL